MRVARVLVGRPPGSLLLAADVLTGCVLTAGALVALGALPSGEATPAAAIIVVACTSAVGWRRRAPVTAFVVAALSLGLYQLVSGDKNAALEPYAVALTAYMVGRRSPAWSSTTAWAGIGSVAGLALLLYSFGSKETGSVVGAWFAFFCVPWGLGWIVARHHRLADELAEAAAEQQRQEQIMAEQLASEERNRVARELHDVTAHSLSAMVVQAGAAQMVAATDVSKARSSLELVIRSGREAMDDLRRIVGVLRRGEDDVMGTPRDAKGLELVVTRAAASGIDPDLRVEGDFGALPASVQFTVFRVVQEALTNAAKHGGVGPVRVEIACSEDNADVSVTNSLRTAGASAGNFPASGHGLIGMRERVAMLGGDVSAGPDRDHFQLRARIPLTPRLAGFADRTGSEPAVAPPGSSDEPVRRSAGLRRLPIPPVDVALAAGWLLVLEVEVATSAHRRGSLVLNAAAVGAMAVAALGRRRFPLAFMVVVGGLAAMLSHGLTSRDYATITGTSGVMVPLYATGAYADGGWAVTGLIGFEVIAGLFGLSQHAAAGGIIGPALLGAVTWFAGRAVRAERLLQQRLRAVLVRLSEERQDHARLAVIGERSRLARDLHSAVAQHVGAMVIQAELADHLLASRDHREDEAVDAIEAILLTGRIALVGMREALGVLRSHAPEQSRTPEPGIGMAHALIRESRDQGRDVRLSMEGEPAPLSPGLDLMAYRILQEAVGGPSSSGRVDVVVRYGAEHLDIEVLSTTRREWPTPAMRQRTSFCDGRLEVTQTGGRRGTTQLTVQLPLLVESASA